MVRNFSNVGFSKRTIQQLSLLALVFLFLSVFISSASNVFAGITTQIFPAYITSSPVMIGVSSWVSAPYTQLSVGWASTPVAVTNYDSGVDGFMESGATRNCDANPSCPLIPYATWRSVNGNPGISYGYGQNLTAGNYYHFYTQRVSGTTWQPVWCLSSCGGATTPQDLSTTAFRSVVAGTETSPGSTMGNIPVHTYNNQYTNTSYTTSYWCYTDVRGYGVPNRYLVVSPRPCSSYRWDITY